MANGLADAGIVLSAPARDLDRVSGLRPAQARLAVVRLTCSGQSGPRRGPAIIAAFNDPTTLHVSNLGEDGDDDFTDTATDRAQTVDVNGDAHVDQSANGRLNIECVAAKPIDRRDVEGVTFANVR